MAKHTIHSHRRITSKWQTRKPKAILREIEEEELSDEFDEQTQQLEEIDYEHKQ
jgi:hypothetical protein